MSLDRSRSMGHQVNWAARLFARDMDRRLKPLGLSSSQLPVLLALAAYQTLSQKGLVARSSVEQPAMARMLDRMEREGLVSKKPDPLDGRAYLYSLTEKSQSKLPAISDAMSHGNEHALHGITQEEIVIALKTLARINQNLADPDVLPPYPPPSNPGNLADLD